MGNVSRLSELQYEQLVSDRSESLPMWGLDASDITLYGRDLELVMRNYIGGMGQFTLDALGDSDDIGDMPATRLASRAVHHDLSTAKNDAGLCVVAALMDYAAKCVLIDIKALRDRQHVYDKYDAARDEADSLNASRGM